MNRKSESKSQIPPLSPESLVMFRENREAILEEAVSRSYGFPEEITQRGQVAKDMIRSGLGYTLNAIDTAMQYGMVDILNFQIQWGMERLKQDGIQLKHVLHRFQILKDVICETLPIKNAEEINRFFSWLILEQEKKLKNGGA